MAQTGMLTGRAALDTASIEEPEEYYSMRSVFACFIGLKLLVLLTLTSTAWAQTQSDAQSQLQASKEMGAVSANKEADLKTARLHFSNGVALLQESPPNYQDAWQQFRLALAKSGGSWKVRGNLGYCALKLERDGEALEQYRLYLKEGGNEIDPKERADIERELLLLEGNMSWVTITSSAPEVELAVARSGSSSPPQGYALSGGEAKLGLRAGSFTITAIAGDQSLIWEPLLTPGKQTTHHFDFNASTLPPADANAGGATKGAPSDQAPSPHGRGPSVLQMIGYASLGVGVLSAGAGIVTGVMAKSKEKQAKENCVDGTCPASDLSKRDAAQGLATATNVLFIAGGVLAATGVTLVIVGKPKKTESAHRRLELSPGVEWGGGSLLLSGTY
jgi:hypothetical protein